MLLQRKGRLRRPSSETRPEAFCVLLLEFASVCTGVSRCVCRYVRMEAACFLMAFLREGPGGGTPRASGGRGPGPGEPRGGRAPRLNPGRGRCPLWSVSARRAGRQPVSLTPRAPVPTAGNHEARAQHDSVFAVSLMCGCWLYLGVHLASS